MEGDWKVLLKKDFNLDYTGVNAEHVYKEYTLALDIFTKGFPIITTDTLHFIINHVPKQYWEFIVEQNIKTKNKLYSCILEINLIAAILDDYANILNVPFDIYDYVNDPIKTDDFNNMLLQIKEKGCDEIYRLAKKPTRVYMNKIPIIISYDPELIFYLTMYSESTEVMQYFIQYWPTLLK